MTFKIYSRKSVFSEKGESIENQIELCRQYILSAYPGSTDADITVYEDEGFSGKTLARPRFQAMMREIREAPPNCLVCYRLDRISRSVSDFAALIEELNRLKVAFICIREKFDTGTPMGKAMLYIASVFAQLERETIAERVRDNMLMLARTGRWLGGSPPTGYTAETVQEVIFDSRSKSACRLVPVPSELNTVAMIYRLFQEQRSLNGLRKELHRRAVTSCSGVPYSLPALREILQNPVYCTADDFSLAYFQSKNAEVCFSAADAGRGLLAYNKRDYGRSRSPRNPIEKWIVAPGRHPGLISGQDWCAVQELLARNSSPAVPHNSYSLLSGQILCTRCGNRMLAKKRAKKDGRFDYICQTKLLYGTSACGCPNLPGEKTDLLVFQALLSHLLPRSLPALAEQVRRDILSETHLFPQPGPEKQLSVRQKELERLTAALGTVPPDSATARTILSRAAEIEAELRELACRQVPSFAPISLNTLVQDLSLAEQRALVRLALCHCRWDGAALHLHLRSPKLP